VWQRRDRVWPDGDDYLLAELNQGWCRFESKAHNRHGLCSHQPQSWRRKRETGCMPSHPLHIQQTLQNLQLTGEMIWP
jgi:hypothetical protein